HTLSSYCFTSRPHTRPFPTRRSSDLDGRPGKQESYDEGKDPQNFDAGCVFMHQSSSAASCPQAPSISFPRVSRRVVGTPASLSRDRKSTRLNSSHVSTSYAVFCLKKQ